MMQVSAINDQPHAVSVHGESEDTIEKASFSNPSQWSSEQTLDIAEETHHASLPEEPEIQRQVSINEDVQFIGLEVPDDTLNGMLDAEGESMNLSCETPTTSAGEKLTRFSTLAEVQTYEVFTETIPIQGIYDDTTVGQSDEEGSILSCENPRTVAREKQARFSIGAEVRTYEVFREMIPIQGLCDDMTVGQSDEEDKILSCEIARTVAREKKTRFSTGTEVQTYEVFTEMIPVPELYDDMTIGKSDEEDKNLSCEYPAAVAPEKQTRFSTGIEVQTYEVFTEMIPTQELYDDITFVVQSDEDATIQDLAQYKTECAKLVKRFGDEVEVRAFEIDAKSIDDMTTTREPPFLMENILEDLGDLLAELVDPAYFQDSGKITLLNEDRGLTDMPTCSDFERKPELDFRLSL